MIALQMIRTVEFLQKLSTTGDVTKYHGILVLHYFLRRYIIVEHFLIPCIPVPDAQPTVSKHKQASSSNTV